MILMICAGCHNVITITVAQCSANTVKAIRCGMDRCKRNYSAVASKKGHSKHSDCIGTLGFLQQLQDKMMEDLSKEVQFLTKHGCWSLHHEAGSEWELLLPVVQEINFDISGQRQLLNEKQSSWTNWDILLKWRNDQVLLRQKELLLAPVGQHSEQQGGLTYHPCNFSHITKIKFPKTVMVFGCIPSEGDIKPPLHLWKGP